MDGETLAGWGVISRSPHGTIDIMFGPVVTAEAHLAFSGARAHSNNTAGTTAMIEALSFLGPHGPVARNEQSCIYYDSKHAAGACLVTIQARTHVQLALACQGSMLCAQHRLRLTMQHVYGHGGNLSNECADHAAALGRFGLTSSHIGAPAGLIITLTQHIRTDVTSLPKIGVSVVFTIGFNVFLVHLKRIFVSLVILLSAFFLRMGTLFSGTRNGKLFVICLYRAAF